MQTLLADLRGALQALADTDLTAAQRLLLAEALIALIYLEHEDVAAVDALHP